MTGSGDMVVGVTMLFDPADGSPEGVAEITRWDALGSRLAFELAQSGGDTARGAELIRQMCSEPDGDDPAVILKALIVLATSVVGPAMRALGEQADPLLKVFRSCADEFRSMTD